MSRLAFLPILLFSCFGALPCTGAAGEAVERSCMFWFWVPQTSRVIEKIHPALRTADNLSFVQTFASYFRAFAGRRLRRKTSPTGVYYSRLSPFGGVARNTRSVFPFPGNLRLGTDDSPALGKMFDRGSWQINSLILKGPNGVPGRAFAEGKRFYIVREGQSSPIGYIRHLEYAMATSADDLETQLIAEQEFYLIKEDGTYYEVLRRSATIGHILMSEISLEAP